MIGGIGIRKVAAVLSFAVLAGGLGCEEAMQPADPDAKMREIYFLSYLPGQVDPVGLYVEQALGQQKSIFTAEQYAVAEKVVHEQMSAEKLEAATLKRLAAQPQREYLDEGLAWLNTPNVRKFMAKKSAAWSPTGLQEMKVYLEKEPQNPPSERRLALIERYDTATNSSGLTAETMLLSAYGVAVMHDALQPTDQRLGPQKLQDSMATQRSVLTPIFKETSTVAHKFAFGDLSDDELEEIVVFAESNPGQWLYTTISTTFLNGVLESTANLGSLFLAALPEPPPTS
jgi:hypothetical protein